MRTHIDCCKDCMARHRACHDHCELYKKQKAEIKAAKDKQWLDEGNYHNYVVEGSLNIKDKMRKRKVK